MINEDFMQNNFFLQVTLGRTMIIEDDKKKYKIIKDTHCCQFKHNILSSFNQLLIKKKVHSINLRKEF